MNNGAKPLSILHYSSIIYHMQFSFSIMDFQLFLSTLVTTCFLIAKCHFLTPGRIQWIFRRSRVLKHLNGFS